MTEMDFINNLRGKSFLKFTNNGRVLEKCLLLWGTLFQGPVLHSVETHNNKLTDSRLAFCTF